MWDNDRCYYVDIPSHKEDDGHLLVVEGDTKTIPFEIKRIFWVRDVKEGAERGQHATKRTRLVLIAVNGSCDVVVNDGSEERVYRLDDPTKGLYIDRMLWRTMKNFTPDCIVEAVCDMVFDRLDETYDSYNEYLDALKG